MTVPSVAPRQIRTALLLRDEIALLDVRHEAVFATGHPLFAANMAADRIVLEARIGRIDRAGLALFPDGLWPTGADIEAERSALQQRHRERRASPRLPIPLAGDASGTGTPLRDVSAGGLRYALTRFESAPAIGSRIEGALQLDADTAIEVRGRVVRHVGREIAVAFDPPGLDPSVLELLHQRFFPG